MHRDSCAYVVYPARWQKDIRGIGSTAAGLPQQAENTPHRTWREPEMAAQNSLLGFLVILVRLES